MNTAKSLADNLPSTYRTAINYGANVGVVIIRHLFIIGAQEADSLVVVVLVLVVPGHRLVAVVGHVLPARRAQQPQESHLDHTNGVALRIHVGELQRETHIEFSTESTIQCKGWVDREGEYPEDPQEDLLNTLFNVLCFCLLGAVLI